MGLDVLEYVVKGAIIIAGLIIAIIVLAPLALGYVLAVILWKIIDFAKDHLRKPRKLKPVIIDEKTLRMQALKRARRHAYEIRQIEIEGRKRREEQKRIKEAEEYVRYVKQDEEFERKEEEFRRAAAAAKTENMYLERELSAKRREELFAQGFKRLKTSPFGDSGASYYWVKTRYNESKEHAFFCYLIDAEVKEFANVELNVNNGPDVVFESNGKYCFDVETGTNERNPQFLKKKFASYKRNYRSFIFVTDKTLKYRYAKYGSVVTRSTLRKTIREIFS